MNSRKVEVILLILMITAIAGLGYMVIDLKGKVAKEAPAVVQTADGQIDGAKLQESILYLNKKVQYLEIFQDIYTFEINYLRNSIKESNVEGVDEEEATELLEQRLRDDKIRVVMDSIISEMGKKDISETTLQEYRDYHKKIREQISEK